MRFLFVLFFSSAGLICTSQSIDKSYSAFDFVAGEKAIFDDHVQTAIRYNAHPQWDLDGGEISTFDFGGQKCISIDAYYTKLKPVLFGLGRLPDSISIEYDTWLHTGYDGNPGIEIHILQGDQEEVITPNKDNLTVSFPDDGRVAKENPDVYFDENKFYNRWIHISIA